MEKKIWANHSDVFHTSQGFGEYGFIAKHTGRIFDYILYILLLIFTLLRTFLIKKENQAMNACFGNNTKISDSEFKQVRKVVWDNMVIFKWKKCDIVMLDNQVVSHGRLPFSGKRKIIVSWGESY